MNGDTLPITTPVVTRHRDNTITLNDGTSKHHYPNADVAMAYHAHIVQLIGQAEQRALEAERVAAAEAGRAAKK